MLEVNLEIDIELNENFNITNCEIYFTNDELNKGCNCPICLEDLFNSVNQASFLECGHSIHKECLAKYVETLLLSP